MNKLKPVVLIGIILSTVGVILLVVGAIVGIGQFKNYDKFIEGKINLNENDYTLEFENSDVYFYDSDEETSYIEYKVFDFYTMEEKSSSVKMTGSKNFLFFSRYKNSGTVKVFLTEAFNSKSIDLKLNACTLKNDNTLNFKNFILDANASSIAIKNLNTTSLTNIKLNASSAAFSGNNTESLRFDVNAGSLAIISNFNTLNFTINAGDVELVTSGSEQDYTFNVSTSVGSTNTTNGGNGSKTVTGNVSVGNFKMKYVN